MQRAAIQSRSPGPATLARRRKCLPLRSPLRSAAARMSVPKRRRERASAKARQVSTHTHDAAPADVFASYRQIGHADFKSIPANGSWEFPTMNGPGSIASIWLTVAGRMREAIIRRQIPAQRYLWLNIYYDGSDTAAVSAPIGHFFGNGTTRYTHILVIVT